MRSQNREVVHRMVFAAYPGLRARIRHSLYAENDSQVTKNAPGNNVDDLPI
jgi:hypothetical protein